MIPGVSRVKALYLFQSGIASIEEFIGKAFHGERLSKNFSRTVKGRQRRRGEFMSPKETLRLATRTESSRLATWSISGTVSNPVMFKSIFT